MAANSSGTSPDEFILRLPIEDPEAFDVNHLVEVQKGLLQLLELGKRSDVTFIITEDGEDHRIPAHRVILASQSEYFDQLLFGGMMEAYLRVEIQLQDTPLKAFQLLMRYTYCGEMKIEDSDLQLLFDVVRLADRFGFHFLKRVLGDHLANIVCTSNVLPILMHADLLQLEEAKANCFHFLDANAKWILKAASVDFLSLPQKYLEDIVCRDSFVAEEIDIFELVRKWLEYNNKTKEDSASLLKVVRLCEIPPELLFAVVGPSGLFDKERISEALQVSYQLELEHTVPRGFTEPDQNIFELESVMYQYTYNLSPQPNWKETSKTESGVIQQQHSFQPSGIPQSPTSIIIDLSRVYLVNNITFELMRLSSQYTIQVSRDNRTWSHLIDYSIIKMICSSRQVLWFPKQAVRYMQFVPGRRCTVQFHSCALKSEVPAFALRDPGVIAPLEPFTPLHLCKTTNANSDGMAGYVVTFHQPYSFSLLRLVLLRDVGLTDRIDVQVTIQGHAQVYDFKDQEFSKDIEVTFEETFVRRFTVMAKPTEEQVQSKKRRKLDESNVWEVAYPSTIIGLFKMKFVCQAF